MYKSFLSQIGHQGLPGLYFFRRVAFIPKRHNDRFGGYAFLRYCDGVIPITCLKILVKCDIS